MIEMLLMIPCGVAGSLIAENMGFGRVVQLIFSLVSCFLASLLIEML